MATLFHPLPVDLFGKEARASVSRLNRELRDLFGLEGTISSPSVNRRSDKSIVRKVTPQVHVTQITPSLPVTPGGSLTITRATTLGTAPQESIFKVKIGPPDELYVSMKMTGGTYQWIPIVFAP